MADLDDRGQIILIAAFALAVTFVSLALVVNSAIFTENLASRGETAGSDDALVVRHEIQQSVGESITYANAYNVSTEDRQAANVSESVAAISSAISTQQAATGKIVTIDGPTAFENGTRIRDNTSGGGSTFVGPPPADASDWEVATNVEQTRAFRLNVSDPANGVVGGDNFGGPRDDEFQLNVTDGSDTWRVNVTEDGSSGPITVGVKEPDGDEGICQAPSSRDYVIVDLTRGLVGDEPCPHLDFGAGVDPTYKITFNNSDNIRGNYSVVLGESASPNVDIERLSLVANPDDPYITNAIYSANVTYRYDGSAITYNTSVRVAPGEPR